MRTIIFIVTLLFAVTSWGQIQTAVTKVKSPVIYENGKNGFIKKGVKIVILSEHIGNNLCEFVHNKKVGKINIDNLVLDKELDNFFFATERMEKAKQIEIEAFNERAKIITPLILPRIKERKLSYKGIIIKRAEIFNSTEAKKEPFNTIVPTYLNYGDSVTVFYYHKDKDKKIAGVTTTYSCGFIDATSLLMDSVCIDSLHYINKADKDKYALEFRSHRITEINNYMLEVAKQKKEAERQEKITKQNERFNKGYLIEIERLYFEMNSAGLLEPYIRITNNSSKDIKYITFNFYWKNRVDDVLTNSINRSETHSLCELTGYIKGYESSSGSWDTSFYNTTAETIHISSISIIYRDGSRRTIGSQKCKELVQASK